MSAQTPVSVATARRGCGGKAARCENGYGSGCGGRKCRGSVRMLVGYLVRRYEEKKQKGVGMRGLSAGGDVEQVVEKKENEEKVSNEEKGKLPTGDEKEMMVLEKEAGRLSL
ncbi:hypothetical protein ACLMJK_008685 [Lecanora helva]